MKIGIFTDTYLPQVNGVAYTIELWKKGLEKRGHDVFVYYPDSGDYYPNEGDVPLTSIPFAMYKGYNIGLPQKRKIEKDLDVIHVQTPAVVGLFGISYARQKDIPAIMTFHTPPELYFKDIMPISNDWVNDSLEVAYFKYEKKLLSRFDLVTAPSEVIIDMLKDRAGTRMPSSISFSNGIDTEFFKEDGAKSFKKKYNLSSGKLIGFAGRHSEGKHVEDLIGIADDFDGTILISGEGPSTKRYKALGKGKKNIQFLGFLPRNDLRGFYSAIDILIMPSTCETEGLVVLEANACNTPCVGVDVLALKNTIKGGRNGYHYAPGDKKDLLASIEKCYCNLEGLKESSRKFAEERSFDATILKLEDAYKTAIKEHKYRSKHEGLRIF